MDLIFEGNKHRHPKYKVQYLQWNNDFVNREEEKKLEDHYIKWYRHNNNLPDESDEDEEGRMILA